MSHIPAQDWQKVSSTKAFNRFRPPAVTAAVAALELAQEHHAAACAAAWTTFLADFAELYLPFRGATQALAALDVLHSLACVARNAGCAENLHSTVSLAACLLVCCRIHCNCCSGCSGFKTDL